MRITVRKFGDVLTSRSAGREAHLAMQAYLLKSIGKGETIEVDFSGVRVLTPAWADEFLSPLFDEYKGGVALLYTKENPSVQLTLEFLEGIKKMKFPRGEK